MARLYEGVNLKMDDEWHNLFERGAKTGIIDMREYETEPAAIESKQLFSPRFSPSQSTSYQPPAKEEPVPFNCTT